MLFNNQGKFGLIDAPRPKGQEIQSVCEAAQLTGKPDRRLRALLIFEQGLAELPKSWFDMAT